VADVIWQDAVRQTWAGKEFVNVITIIDTTGVAAFDTIAANVEDAWTASNSFADVVQTDSIHYTGHRLRDITNNGATIEYDWQSSTDTGSASTETMPPSVALCYTVKTNTAGRSYRGRMFIGGVRHNLYNSSQTAFDLAGSAGVLASGAGEAFRASLDSANTPLGVYSRKLNIATPCFVCLTQGGGLASQRHRANRYAQP
jgi:hypothetical protein